MSAALALYGAAVAACILGGIISIGISSRSVARSIAGFAGTASVLALAAGALGLSSPEHMVLLWGFPTLGRMALGTTHLGAFFTCTAALVYLPVSIYTAGYLRRYEEHYSPRAFALWYYALCVAIIVLPICQDVVSFFIVWEIVAVASAALVAYEWRDKRNARAAYVMLAMSEAGTLAAIIAVLIALSTMGTLIFAQGAGVPLPGAAKWAVFVLSFFGFGVKAGLIPVNSWLPRAHPVAPGNISALLSGVILNLGVYGILLVNLQLVPVGFVGCGALALLIGAISALLGILYAAIDDDLKTMLAYSSVENIGIAVTGIGAGFVFIAVHEYSLAAIGLAAGMYHVLNHSSYKALLFLTASTVHAQTGERSIDRLGGLIRFMPATSFCFFVGALAIAAVPPFNGFASEWLTLESLLRSAELAPPWLRITFALSGAAIALTAALAITCFVKAFGFTFLGVSRMSGSRPISEPSCSMRSAGYLLAAACALLGFLPTYVLGVIDLALSSVLHGHWVQRTLVPAFFGAKYTPDRLPADFVQTFHALGAQLGYGIVPGRGLVIMLRGGASNPVVFAMSSTYLALTLLLFFGILYAAVRTITHRKTRRITLPWAGGLATVPPTMTYTGTGFSNPVRVIFNAVFRPSRQDERTTVHEHFRTAITRRREDVFVADRVVAQPAIRIATSAARAAAGLHHGRLPAYVGYALVTLLVALAVGILT